MLYGGRSCCGVARRIRYLPEFGSLHGHRFGGTGGPYAPPDGCLYNRLFPQSFPTHVDWIQGVLPVIYNHCTVSISPLAFASFLPQVKDGSCNSGDEAICQS